MAEANHDYRKWTTAGLAMAGGLFVLDKGGDAIVANYFPKEVTDGVGSTVIAFLSATTVPNWLLILLSIVSLIALRVTWKKLVRSPESAELAKSKALLVAADETIQLQENILGSERQRADELQRKLDKNALANERLESELAALKSHYAEADKGLSVLGVALADRTEIAKNLESKLALVTNELDIMKSSFRSSIDSYQKESEKQRERADSERRTYETTEAKLKVELAAFKQALANEKLAYKTATEDIKRLSDLNKQLAHPFPIRQYDFSSTVPGELYPQWTLTNLERSVLWAAVELGNSGNDICASFIKNKVSAEYVIIDEALRKLMEKGFLTKGQESLIEQLYLLTDQWEKHFPLKGY